MPQKRKSNLLDRAKKPDVESNTIFFYMPKEKPYGVFCQWHPSPITIPTKSLQSLGGAPTTPNATDSATSILMSYGESVAFTCAEQMYMFSKALYFLDPASCTRILGTRDPKEQKKLGQAVKNFNDYEWTHVKAQVARLGNWYKFTHPVNAHMRNVLLGTQGKELAEAARRDRVWGIGYNAEEAERYRGMWGENLLGKALMMVRERLDEMVKREGEGEDGKWDWDGELEEEGGGSVVKGDKTEGQEE